MTVTITGVRQSKSGFWVVSTSDGRRHATKSMFVASAADIYRKNKTPVRVLSFGGWYYRDLQDITPVEAQKEAS